MKRRAFLKTPAVTLLLPAAGTLAAVERLTAAEPEVQAAQSAAAKFTQRVHQDFNTYHPGIEYFFLGNGDMQAVVQYCPDRSGDLPPSYLGLTLMDAEHFSRKWSTYLFHPERGYERSMLDVRVDGKGYAATPQTVTGIRWKLVEAVPVVSLTWKAGTVAVEEEFYVPPEGGTLIRNVRVRNSGDAAAELKLFLQLVPNFALFDEIGTDPKGKIVFGRGYTEVTLRCLDGEVSTAGRYDLNVGLGSCAPGAERSARFVYTIRPGTKAPGAGEMESVWRDTVAFWAPKPVLKTGNEILDRLYMLARTGLKSQLAHSGKRDSGYWMYNMEWVRDDVMMLQAMAMAGLHDEAKSILLKIFQKSVGPDGCLIESSRWSGPDYTELDQNGQLVYAAWLYLCWTDDLALIKQYWEKIRLAGEFPLQDVFRNPRSKLLRNKREFWERRDQDGVEDGFELLYNFWVCLGLEKGSEVARRVGDEATAKRWAAVAAEMKNAILNDPTFRFIEEGHLIKRRTLDGCWQRYFIPPNRASMPPGSPMALEEKPECEPDSSNVYPIIYGFVDPRGDVSKKTLLWMDQLWNQRWTTGGYSRYNTSSEPDPPAPWPIASLLIARAAVEAGEDARVWKSLNWVSSTHGGLSGGWFERYGPSITPPAPPVSVVGWAWAEIILLMVHHIMGFRPELDGLTIRPRLITGVDTVSTRFTIRGATVDVEIRRGSAPKALVDGKVVAVTNGTLNIPYPRKGSIMRITMDV